MSKEKYCLPNFKESEQLVDELFEDLKKPEGFMSGGDNLPLNMRKVNEIQKTKVTFGNPENELTKLTEDKFSENGIELNSKIKEQIKEKFDFYYLSLNVNLKPLPGVRFWRLSCELNFTEEQTIIQSLFPTHQWQSAISIGAGMSVGVNGDLAWDVGVDSSLVEEILKLAGNSVKGVVKTKDEFNAFAKIPTFKYEFGKPEIVAVGEGENIAFWRIQDKQIQKVGTAQFGLVFKVPQGTNSVTLTGTTWADVSINWLTADITDTLFVALPNRWQNLFQLNQEEIADKFIKGDQEQWVLELPN